MTNTQIAERPYWFLSASSLASSTVSTWEDLKARCLSLPRTFHKAVTKAAA